MCEVEKHKLKNSSYYINESGQKVIELPDGSVFYIKDKYSFLEAYDIMLGEFLKREFLVYLCREDFSSKEMSWCMPYEKLVDMCLKWLYQNSADNLRILKRKVNDYEID